MTDLEKTVVRLECAVDKLDSTAKQVGKMAIDVAVLKNESHVNWVKDVTHYAVTTVAVALGIKSNI